MQPIRIRRDPLKRLFDIAFSALCLALFSPLMLVIAILVYGSSPGAILYRSCRLGQGGKKIECLKFRTMVSDADAKLNLLLASDTQFCAEWALYRKCKADPRITPLGKLLRKTSLDELPQFWNVLKGDLSIVGPRSPALIGPPAQHMQEIQSIYGASAREILSVKPGITGIWQISGRSGISVAEKGKMEKEYALSRTFWTDLKVIAKTIPAVLFSKGAF